jgi:hypothetical protein
VALIQQSNHFDAFSNLANAKTNHLTGCGEASTSNILLHFKELPMEQAQRTLRQFSLIHLEPAEVLALLGAAKAKGSREWAMLVLAYKCRH